MNTKYILLILVLGACAFAQTITISEKNVSRIVQTLSSDDMRGRSALAPADIERATAFIENEFKQIGLSPLPGLQGFRQSFTKERVRPGNIDVTADGKPIPNEEVLVISDNKNIEHTNTASAVSVSFDASIADIRSHFFQRFSAFMRDTTSTLMVVAPEFRGPFNELKGYFREHFTGNRTHDKIVLLGAPADASFSVNVTQHIETITMNNVVGIIPGTTRPDEMVLFSAHYDHIGILPPVEGDSIANGADDNASGTAAVIELARYFKKAENHHRTLVFVAFTAEESGGLGSKYFSEQLDPEKIVAMLNIEMIGKPSKWGRDAAFITGYDKSDLGSILATNAKGTGFSFHPDPYPEQNLFYRSDNATLARLGVPAHTISTDQIDSDPYYHTVDDEFSTIDVKNIAATIRAIAAGARTIVEGTDTPSRIDKTTVR